MSPDLERLARLMGVEPGYHDIWGNWHAPDEDALRALLAAMGVDAMDDAEIAAELAAHEIREWSRVVAPISVLRRAQLAHGVRIRIDEASLARPLAWRIVQESGEIEERAFTPVKLQMLDEHGGDGARVHAFSLPLPPELPDGYHRLAILEGDTLLGEGVLAVVPEKCFLPQTIADGGRVWGTTVQLYGLRSARNAGIGNFTDLRKCAELWGSKGAGIVGVNPLHALSLRDPGPASPYSPSSRLFLNPLYVDIESVPDFHEVAEEDPACIERWRSRTARLRAAETVDYPGVAEAMREMFDALYANFRKRHLSASTPRGRAFARFRESRGAALRRHALHEALAEFHGKPWREWPEEHRDPSSEAVRRFAHEQAERVALHEYVQWQADQQLAAAQSHCDEMGMAVGLYADLAISIGSDGSEAWANQKLYALGMSVGAPPDEFNRGGQDWGLPPLVPQRLRDAGYAPFIATLRANMARAGALRIDHVMGLARLYWVPHGMKADRGAYVSYPADDLLGIVALESHRQRCLVIGEDLGTVPPELVQKLAQAEVLSYRVLMFERQGDRFRAARELPRRALVAWSTHDLPTFYGWWRGEDIPAREAFGILTAEQAQRERDDRVGARWALVSTLKSEGLVPDSARGEGEPTEELDDAVQVLLANAPSAVMVVQMEDVLGLAEQANLPGTVEQHPNWRRKLPVALEDWRHDPRVRRMAHRLAAIRGGRKLRRDVPAGLERARIPRSTYRIQLHGEFTFRDATALVPYWAALGVSHIYCSPYLRARPGSKHGYDIIDHDAINPEIGTREELDAFAAEMRRHGLAQMMDIVPNHMGVLAADNAWWQDLLENGPASTLAEFFDIDWHPPNEHLRNRVLLPVLGDHYGVELSGGKLQLGFEPATGSFAINYYTHRLPVDPREYPRILASAVRSLEGAGQDRVHQAQALRSIMESFARLPRRGEAAQARRDERNLNKEIAKGRLATLARSSGPVSEAIGRAVEALNGQSDDPTSFDALHDLLERQSFRLAYWRVAQDEINYRRFFDINDLAALRQENDAVFNATHRLILQLVREGIVEALRIDHPDGLFDPRAYFRKLQEACGKPTYVAVEKIVAPFENLPEDWAVHGTTGYRFANVVNGLFVDPTAEARMTRTYHSFIGDETDFEESARRSRRLILRTSLSSELTVLASRLMRIARADRNTRDFTFTTLRDGLAEVIASFPVYRTYIDAHVSPEDRRYIDWAVTRARSQSRAADVGVFDFIRDALMCELPTRSPATAAAVRTFARKFQQLTSPVMAKGIEDTTFYIYNRLVSLNDVGGDPSEFGMPRERFHRASANRARHWPHTMLATSTHDNKRSEDVRARINVLSEMVPAWRLRLRRWHRLNLDRKTEVDGAPAPSRNDEYLLYQVLLGSYPADRPRGEALGAWRERIEAYMLKAMREAKVHTSWANQNAAYEQATARFIGGILDDAPGNAFLGDFRANVAPVMWLGFLNSLSMVAVKYTSPGVPDLYQGNETWDFSLVDPDNRRPVDYAMRRRMLDEVNALAPDDARIGGIFADLHDGRAKLFLTHRLLRLRTEREDLFTRGSYTALRTAGAHARGLAAYARRQGRQVSITVAPRLMAALGVVPGRLPCGELWGDTRVDVPFLDDGDTLRDAITGRSHAVSNGGFAVRDLLTGAPVAVLIL
jgi:(1->4)-alpha-D-glucan 1-alpha-D-glucosylmutase